jgi:hypothetical protein
LTLGRFGVLVGQGATGLPLPPLPLLGHRPPDPPGPRRGRRHRPTAWIPIEYPDGGVAEVAETPFGGDRLVVRRTRLVGAEATLWPDWRYHAFVTDREGGAVALDADHRRHAVMELAIRDLKHGAGLRHCPSGRFLANAGGEQLGAFRQPVVEQDRVDALVPAGALADQGTAQPNPGPRVGDVGRWHPRPGQRAGAQQLAQVAGVGAVGLGAWPLLSRACLDATAGASRAPPRPADGSHQSHTSRCHAGSGRPRRHPATAVGVGEPAGCVSRVRRYRACSSS